MGTTADKLNKILETKQAIRQAIITKGVDVGEDTKFADYPSRIAAIQTGSGEGGSDAFFNLRTQNGTDFSNLFYCYTGSELDLSGLDTSQVTNMNNMFTYSYGLTSLNLSNWDTRNVGYMYGMFSNCSALSSLDLSGFNTSNVSDMSFMFSYCTGLVSLNLNNWDTRNVTNMNSMFNNCVFYSLDLNSFDTSNVNSMNAMFNNCFSLKELNISSFNTSNVNDMNCMFAYCYGLKSLDISHFNTSNVTNIDSMFAWCTNLEELDIRNFNVNNIEYVNCMFEGCSMLHKLRFDNCGYDTINKIINSASFPTGEATDAAGNPLNVPRQMYVQEANIVGLMAPDGWEFVYVESSEGGEPGIPEGPTITPEPSEPEEPTQTYEISFSTLGSKKLTVNNVDVTDQVVETGGYGDTISCKYETTDVIRQASFKDNTDLVRVFGLDTSMMFHTEEMFSGCTNLVAILPVLDSGMVYSTRAMFKNCTSLTSMGTIGSFSTASNKSEMFYNCTSLTGTVSGSAYWLNDMITEYANCFYNCTSLDNYSDIPAEWGGPSNE